MKELYITPEVKFVGFVASDKIAFSQELNISWLDNFTLGGFTESKAGDIKLPLSGV